MDLLAVARAVASEHRDGMGLGAERAAWSMMIHDDRCDGNLSLADPFLSQLFILILIFIYAKLCENRTTFDVDVAGSLSTHLTHLAPRHSLSFASSFVAGWTNRNRTHDHSDFVPEVYLILASRRWEARDRT
jgi:hypothetical protein